MDGWTDIHTGIRMDERKLVLVSQDIVPLETTAHILSDSDIAIAKKIEIMKKYKINHLSPVLLKTLG